MHDDAATADKLQGQMIQGQTPDHLGAKEAPEGGAQAHAPRARQARRLQAQALRAEFGGGGGAEVVGEGGGQRGLGAELVKAEAPREGQGESKGRGESKGQGESKGGAGEAQGKKEEGGQGKKEEGGQGKKEGVGGAGEEEVGAGEGAGGEAAAVGGRGRGSLGEGPGASAQGGRGAGVGGAAQRLDEGVLPEGAAPEARGVPYEHAFHSVWARSPLGDGAGNYGKMGEGLSGLRLLPAGEAFARGLGLGGLRDGTIGAIKFMGEKLFGALQSMNGKFAKFVPIAGGVLSIGGGLYALSRFNLHDSLAELKSAFSDEGWREDPFGCFADVLHLGSSGVGLLQAALDVLGGCVDVLSGLCLLAGPTAPAAGFGIQLAEVIKGTSFVVENANNVFLKPSVVLLRFLSAISADVDAAGVNKILKKFEAETADAVGGVISAGLNRAGGAPKGLEGVDFSKNVHADQLNAPSLEKGPLASLGGAAIQELFSGGSDGKIHASLRRWAQAQTAMEQERALVTLNDVKRFQEAPVPWPLVQLVPAVGLPAVVGYVAHHKVKPFFNATFCDLAPLPEAPCNPVEVQHDQDVLGELRQTLGRVRKEGLPALRAYQQGCREESARGDELLGAHARLVEQQELAKRALQGRAESQGEAEQRWREVQDKRAAAALEDPRLQEMERQARKVLSLIESVPRELLPDNIARATQAARQVLGGGEAVRKVKEGDAQGRAGGELLQRNRVHLADGERELAQGQQSSARLEEAGQRHKTQAEQLAQEVELALQRGTLDEQELKRRLDDLEARAARRVQELEAWAQAHGGRRERNDKLAEQVLAGALFKEEGGVVGPNLVVARDNAVGALHDCTAFLFRVRAEANPDALVHDEQLLEFVKQHRVDEIIHDGILDCQEWLAALQRLGPADGATVWEEQIGEALDRVGRCRERLRRVPQMQLGRSLGGEVPCAPQEHATPSAPAGQEVVAPSAQVYFGCDAPREGEVDEGGVVRRSGLREVLAYLGGREGAQVRVVGHASVEGSARHNQRLSERRARLVEGLLRPAGGHEVRVEARGEDEAQRAQTGGEYAHEAWRRVDVEVVGGGSARAAG